MPGLHFCLSLRTGFQREPPSLGGSGVGGWLGFLFIFFSVLLGGGLVWLSFVVALFCFILGTINFSWKDLKRLKDATHFSLRPRFFVFCPEQKSFLIA